MECLIPRIVLFAKKRYAWGFQSAFSHSAITQGAFQQYAFCFLHNAFILGFFLYASISVLSNIVFLSLRFTVFGAICLSALLSFTFFHFPLYAIYIYLYCNTHLCQICSMEIIRASVLRKFLLS